VAGRPVTFENVSPEELERLRAKGVQQILEMFDDERLSTAAIGVADATDKLSRVERLIVLLFTTLSTLPHVDVKLRVDIVACVTAMAQDPEMGAAVWLHVAREQGIGLRVGPSVRM
jgi:hypothetical protein